MGPSCATLVALKLRPSGPVGATQSESIDNRSVSKCAENCCSLLWEHCFCRLRLPRARTTSLSTVHYVFINGNQFSSIIGTTNGNQGSPVPFQVANAPD